MDEILRVIADNPALLEAVKRAVLAEFDVNTHSLTFANGLPDQELGQRVRAQITGHKAVEDAFRKIASMKSVPNRPVGDNPAR